MSKTVPLGRPFFVTVRARHIAAGCITKGDGCVVAGALDAAFPALAGRWRVGTGGAVLVPSETPAGKGLIGYPTLGQWTHDAEAHIRRFDRGEGFPPNLRIHVRPGAAPVTTGAAPVTIMGSDQDGNTVPAWWLKGAES